MKKYIKPRINSVVRYFGSAKEARHFDQDPLVIGGCGRSGTTLLLSIMSAHPDIFAIPHESVSLVNWESRARDVSTGGLHPIRIDRLYRHLLKSRIPPGSRRWCEKTPRNIHHAENILKYWSEAQFIHIIRDPRDVLTSRHRNKPGEYWVSLNRWVKDVSKGLDLQDHPRLFTIRYEDLVQDFEPTIQALCNSLGMKCGTEILNWHTHTTVRKNRSWEGKVVKLHSNSLKKWELPEHGERLNQIKGDKRIQALMERLGYR